jgi:hypothetical protein
MQHLATHATRTVPGDESPKYETSKEPIGRMQKKRRIEGGKTEETDASLELENMKLKAEVMRLREVINLQAYSIHTLSRFD